MSRHVVHALILLGALLLAALAPAHAAQFVASASTAVSLDVGKGRLVKLDRPANSVFVADPEIADVQVKSPMLIYLFGKSAGSTTLYAVGDNDEVLLNTNVSVRYDVSRVEQAIRQFAPRSAVRVSAVDDSIVLEGTVYSAAEGDNIRRIAARFVPDPQQLVNQMTVDAPNQINLRVRVAEVSRSVIKEFGVNWKNVVGSGNFMFGLSTANAINPAANFLTGSAARFGSFNLNALIDALDNRGLVTVLAEPNLTALSGEPASFLAGGEFPIPVPSTGNSNVVLITYKKFGVSLNFVATIAANDRISLHVQPEVSQLAANGGIVIDSISVPSLATRRAETTVELASGQSFAIAGLMQNNVNQTMEKFPWLGDVPVLGPLFRSEHFQRNESELVIIVTPYLVRPIAVADRSLSPTDGYVPSSDGELYFQGNEYRPQALKQGSGPRAPVGKTLIGPAGYDLD
jgi:pilus assembly protein CpaC